MICRESQRGAVRMITDGDSITLNNLSGTMVISPESGTLTLHSGQSFSRRSISGKIRIETDMRNYESGGGRSTRWEIETLAKPFDAGITIHCREPLLEGSSVLHWRVHAADGYFVLWAGVSGLTERVLRFVVFQDEDFTGSFGESKMLRLAYCGAHTGSDLSRSRISSISGETEADSWWTTVFSPQSGPPLAMGFLSALRFTGKIETAYGKLQAFNYGERIIAPSASIMWSEPLYVSFKPSSSAGLEEYAAVAADCAGARIRHSGVFGWGSWSEYNDSISDEIILGNANQYLGRVPAATNGAVIQVDHGWEERISTHRPETSWTPRPEFTADMRILMARMNSRKLRKGLWVVPFAVNKGSRYLDVHREYLVRDEAGDPKRVGGKGEGYCIDPTHPDGERWLRDLFSRLKKLGVDYFKLDYLRVLLAPEPSDPDDGLDGIRVYWTGATRVEAYRHGLEIIRDVVGDEVYLLACGAPSLPGAGIVDGHRIGQDIANVWHDGQTGIKDCVRNIACNYFWHKRLWRNDPDYLILPKEDNLRRFWATAIALSGGSSMVSADLSTLTPAQEYTLNAVTPPLGESAAPVELGSEDFPTQWRLPVTAHDETYFLVGFFNPEDTPRLFSLDPRDLEWPGMPHRFIVWDFWKRRKVVETEGIFSVSVPGRDVVLLCIRSLKSCPMLVATSLHYTMGAVEIARMEWSPAGSSLRCDLSENTSKKGFLYFHVPVSYALDSRRAEPFEMGDGVLAVPLGGDRRTTITLEFSKREEGER